VSLNIKDPEVHRLAAAISQLTGKSLTGTVREALQERYDKLKSQESKATVEDLLAIGRRASKGLKKPYPDHAALLYDEAGLPK
jgi:antitoxin VapB